LALKTKLEIDLTDSKKRHDSESELRAKTETERKNLEKKVQDLVEQLNESDNIKGNYDKQIKKLEQDITAHKTQIEDEQKKDSKRNFNS